jgi:hypothetical protein
MITQTKNGVPEVTYLLLSELVPYARTHSEEKVSTDFLPGQIGRQELPHLRSSTK